MDLTLEIALLSFAPDDPANSGQLYDDPAKLGQLYGPTSRVERPQLS